MYSLPVPSVDEFRSVSGTLCDALPPDAVLAGVEVSSDLTYVLDYHSGGRDRFWWARGRGLLLYQRDSGPAHHEFGPVFGAGAVVG